MRDNNKILNMELYRGSTKEKKIKVQKSYEKVT